MLGKFRRNVPLTSRELFEKLLIEKKILSEDGKKEAGKAQANSANVNYLFNSLSPESRKLLSTWSKKITLQSGRLPQQPSLEVLTRRQISRRAELERQAYRLTRPNYVTSYQHYIKLNSHRVGHLEPNDRFAVLDRMFAEERETFAQEQLAELAKRRAAAELHVHKAKRALEKAELEKSKREKKEAAKQARKLARQAEKDRRVTLDKLSPKQIEKQIDAGLQDELKAEEKSSVKKKKWRGKRY